MRHAVWKFGTGVLLGWVLLGGGAVHAEDAPEGVLLSERLDGWTMVDGDWACADGMLVGKAAGAGSAHLMWNARLRDFDLSFEFRTPAAGEGGVYFRAHHLPVLPLAADTAADAAAKQFYGYRLAIDTNRRLGTGQVHVTDGRGKLRDPELLAAQYLKQTDWNTVRLSVRGPAITVWLQGKQALAINDEAFLGGAIALAVVGREGAEQPAEIHFRNVRLTDLGRDGNWRPLFDGATLNGWKNYGEESWTVEDGAIAGRSGPKQSEGYLATEEEWRDFHVAARFKILGEGNYGLFYHSSIALREEDGYPVITGVQAEVEPSWPGSSGWVYESYQRGWLIEPDKASLPAYATAPGAWNDLEVRVRGNKIDTWVNGLRVVDYTDPEPRVTEGFFALQLHVGGAGGVLWKDIAVLETPQR